MQKAVESRSGMGMGPGFLWINTPRDYMVCQSTAACFRSLKTLGPFFLFFSSFKTLGGKKKRGEKAKVDVTVLKMYTGEDCHGLKRGILRTRTLKVKCGIFGDFEETASSSRFRFRF